LGTGPTAGEYAYRLYPNANFLALSTSCKEKAGKSRPYPSSTQVPLHASWVYFQVYIYKIAQFFKELTGFMTESMRVQG
jgi:hypothetical protein